MKLPNRLGISAACLALLALVACDQGGVTMRSDLANSDADEPEDAIEEMDDAAEVRADLPQQTTLTLDPATLTFFALPIGSVRHAVAGYDAAQRLCATLVWDFSNTGHREGAHCDDFGPQFPYVILRSSDTPDCSNWNYDSDVTVRNATGCVDFAGFWGLDLVDVSMEIDSPLFHGRLVADNRARFNPAPVTLSLRYVSDIPENVFVQTGNDYGQRAWVTIRRDGNAILIFDACDVPVCGESEGVCGVAFHTTDNLTQGTYSGSIHLTWDGNERVYDAPLDCRQRVPAAPGSYTATFCYAWQVAQTDSGSDLVDPVCREIPFTMPTERVECTVDMGG